MTQPPDEALVKRAQGGDDASFEELVRRYEHKVHSITYRMLGREEEASEALQETFLRVHRFLPKFEFKSSFYTWLYRIATNVCLTRLRRRKQPSATTPDSDTEGTSTCRSDRREAIQQAIDKMPADYKRVVALRDLDGLSSQEISRILNMSVPAVKSRLHRGRMLLRTMSGERETMGESGDTANDSEGSSQSSG
jgi:RNA polymerase sigma-70 factor (ECF subfamily)